MSPSLVTALAAAAVVLVLVIAWKAIKLMTRVLVFILGVGLALGVLYHLGYLPLR